MTATLARIDKNVMCQHCLVKTATRPRRLCYRCYISPEAQVYQSRNNEGFGLHPSCGSVLPAEPTMTHPGSEDKMRVLHDRCSQGLALHHPRDKTLFEED